jgi:hypothetical protein
MSAVLGYLFKAVLVLTAVAAVAAWPVYALGGARGLEAFGVALAVCMVGAVLGRLPHLFFKRGPDALFHASLTGLGLRLLGTLAVAAPLLLFSGMERVPFAIGLVVAYFALLVLEVRDLVTSSRRPPVSSAIEPGAGVSNQDGVAAQ